MQILRAFTTLLAAGALWLGTAQAAPSSALQDAIATAPTAVAPNTPPKTVTVDIVANKTAGAPRSGYQLAIRLRHEPGWHTYWRFPGDTGYPASVNWQLPKGWQATAVGWPLPTKHKVGDITDFVMSGEVLLPYNIDMPWNPAYNTSVSVSAKVEYLACKDVCIPGEASVRFRVPLRVRSEPSEHAELFTQTLKSIPERITQSAISGVFDQNIIRLDLPASAGQINHSLEFFPLEPDQIDFRSLDRAQINAGQNSALYLRASDIFKESLLNAEPKSLQGVIVADGGPLNGGWAIETEIPLTPASITLPWQDESTSSAQDVTTPNATVHTTNSITSAAIAIFFAFLGGLILNLMPCVFPVLSLKILQLVDGSRRKGSLASHGFAFTGGILLSMLILAGLLIVLRHFGWMVGWGFQLQTPLVVSVLALLFLTLALNLFGLFEFTAASHLADTRAVHRLPTTGRWGSFFTGVLAVVVASPCTAPFMGAALGYAVLKSDVESIAIFLSLGFGMALPWLLLCLVPVWLKWLPKPGAWMVTFKKIMAIPMLAACAWLIWVLAQQVDLYGLLMILLAAGATTAFFWVLGREQFGRNPAGPLKYITAAITVAALLVIAMSAPPKNSSDTRTDGLWRPWSEQAVTEATQASRPVVIDFTAAWCVTCQYNKSVALRTDKATETLKALNYESFSADWTNRDASITAVLNQYNRSGVPLYLLISPHGEVTVLPELLTESSFIQALKDNAAKTK